MIPYPSWVNSPTLLKYASIFNLRVQNNACLLHLSFIACVSEFASHISLSKYKNNNNNSSLIIARKQLLLLLPFRHYMMSAKRTKSDIASDPTEVADSRTSAKRSKSDIASDASGAALLQHQDPHSFATTMLGWLAPDSTLETGDAKKLLKTFDLVKAELQHRTNLMALRLVQCNSELTLNSVAIPQDIFQNILKFIPCYDMVHKASLVSKAWLAVARMPQLWHTLNNDYGLLENSTTITNMTQLLELLNRNPQFASLKVLTPPDKVQMRNKAFEQIAKACPLLEAIDVGYSVWSNMKCDDKALQLLPSIFPHLKELRLNTYKISDSGLAAFCERMGGRLLEIRIRYRYSSTKKLSDHTLAAIAHHCSNLERFEYTEYHGEYDFTETGIISLLNGCRNLKNLTLINTKVVGLGVFRYIMEQDAVQLERLYVTGHDGLMQDVALCAALDEKVDSFEAIQQSVHSSRTAKARRAKKKHITW